MGTFAIDNMKISVIMASYLGPYPGAATNREAKFKRAVCSFLEQDYPDKQLVIVGDGCPRTLELALEIAQERPEQWHQSNVVLGSIEKTPTVLSGAPRNFGIAWAGGEVICYLDTDDVLLPGHLRTISENFGDHQWVFFDDYLAGSADLVQRRQRCTNLNHGGIGTSCIAHKKNLPVSWPNGYGHDYAFVTRLMEQCPGYIKIAPPGYLVCHTLNHIDY